MSSTENLILCAEQNCTARRELAQARETISRLNRRCQKAEAGVAEQASIQQRTGPNLGRALANARCAQLERELAEARNQLEQQHRMLQRDMRREQKLAALLKAHSQPASHVARHQKGARIQ